MPLSREAVEAVAGPALGFPAGELTSTLTALEASDDVPARTGIYAAWITDAAALRDVGIDRPAPRIVYVGIATGAHGLRRRLLKHSRGPFQELNELLGVRGRALFCWGYRYLPPGEPRSVGTTPLLEVAERQTLEWQHRHVSWSWSACSPARARALEKEAVVRHEPVLNRKYAERLKPPELRAASRYGKARARWLWHTSWAGLLIGNEHRAVDRTEWPTDSLARIKVDDAGFPLPRSSSLPARPAGRALREPSLGTIEEMMREGARHADVAVRHAVAVTLDDEKLYAWWAAHAGAPLLASQHRVEDAIAASLELRSESSAPCPDRLPADERVTELHGLAATLDAVGH